MGKITKVCSTCGSEDVFVDASAVWDEGQQQWELKDSHVDVSQAFCQDCNDSCTLKDEVMEETPSSGFSPNMVHSLDAKAYSELFQADFNDLENRVIIDSLPSDKQNSIRKDMERTMAMMAHDALKYGGTLTGRLKKTNSSPYKGYDTCSGQQVTVQETPKTRPIQPPESLDSYLEKQSQSCPPDPVIHGKLSADKVLMRTDRDAMFPKFHADFSAGKAILTGGSQPGCDAIDAQDRVILRRHLRRYFPRAVKRVNLSSLGLSDLKAMVNTLKDIEEGDRYDG